MKELFDKVALECSKLTTNSYSTSFSLGIKFLDKSIHNEIYAIYGFVRFADEIVDSFHDYSKEELLTEFKAETWRAIERKISLNPILNSFQWVVNKHDIDHDLIKSFLESMSMDLEDQVYNVDLYKKYILGSAEVVGLMCLKVFVNGCQEKYEKLKEPAMSLGSAFQKINFLRDLGQDSKDLGRSYFPQLQNQTLNDKVKNELIQEITKDFNDAYKGIIELPDNSRFGVYVAYTYYLDLLKKISNSSVEKISQNRIRISNFKKLSLASKAYYDYKLKLGTFNHQSKVALILIAIISSLSCPVMASPKDVRKAYIDCDTNKTQAIGFYDLVKNEPKSNSNEAYLAAAKMVKAKFGINPFRKLSLFKEGRNELEQLISNNPDNVEMRYIRLSIQHSAPIFLSYRDNLKEDQGILVENLSLAKLDPDLQNNIISFLTREDLINNKEVLALD